MFSKIAISNPHLLYQQGDKKIGSTRPVSFSIMQFAKLNKFQRSNRKKEKLKENWGSALSCRKGGMKINCSDGWEIILGNPMKLV